MTPYIKGHFNFVRLIRKKERFFFKKDYIPSYSYHDANMLLSKPKSQIKNEKLKKGERNRELTGWGGEETGGEG